MDLLTLYWDGSRLSQPSIEPHLFLGSLCIQVCACKGFKFFHTLSLARMHEKSLKCTMHSLTFSTWPNTPRPHLGVMRRSATTIKSSWRINCTVYLPCAIPMNYYRLRIRFLITIYFTDFQDACFCRDQSHQLAPC